MKILKNNIKLIIGFFIGLILAGGVVYAAVSASEIGYTRTGSSVKNVSEALNELYTKYNNGELQYDTFDSNGYVNSPSAETFFTKNLSVPEGIKKIYIYSHVASTWGVCEPTITSSSIIEQQNTTLAKHDLISGRMDSASYLTVIDTNGNAGSITIGYGCEGPGDSTVNAIVFYK